MVSPAVPGEKLEGTAWYSACFIMAVVKFITDAWVEFLLNSYVERGVLEAVLPRRW
jgi:hypothetical protein